MSSYNFHDLYDSLHKRQTELSRVLDVFIENKKELYDLLLQNHLYVGCVTGVMVLRSQYHVNFIINTTIMTTDEMATCLSLEELCDTMEERIKPILDRCILDGL